MEQDPQLMQPLEQDFGQPEQPMPPASPEPPVPPVPPQPEQPDPPQNIPQQPFYANDVERMMALPPISRQEARSYQHSHERRWYRRLIEINFLMIIVVIIMVICNFSEYGKQMDELEEHTMQMVMDTLNSMGSESEDSDSAESESADDSKTDDEKDDQKDDEKSEEKDDKKEDDDPDKKSEDDDYFNDFIDNFPLELRMLGYGIVALFVGYLSLYMTLAQVKASSVKITQKNFPEIYNLIFSYAQRLGMKKVPDAYIMQQSGVLNAFSTFIPHRQYIMINTEVFEVAYREHKDMNALAFIIAHEVAHIYYGHATLHYNLPIWFSMNVPLFGQIASRTREYSCDRLAQRLTNYDGIDSMLMLMVDRHLYPMIDKQDYVDQTINERGFFLWLVNLLSSHPIMPKRIRALIRWNGSGELY